MRRLTIFFLLFVLAASTFGQVRFPERPVGTLVYDGATMLSGPDLRAVKELCFGFKQKIGAPIVVCTIPSKSSFGAERESIESYARLLYDRWGIGSQSKNVGVLLLVSRDDREMRIEMGAAWRGMRDSQCEQIVQQTIIPRFQNGDFSQGIRAGVQALSQFNSPGQTSTLNSDYSSGLYGAPSGSGPSPFPDTGKTFFGVIFAVVAIGFVMYLVNQLQNLNSVPGERRRSIFDDDDDHHRGGGFWGGGSSGGSSWGGGSSSGGSFGGGSGGGGGASGKW